MNLEKVKIFRPSLNLESRIKNDAKRLPIPQLAATMNFKSQITNYKWTKALFGQTPLIIALLLLVLSSGCVRNKDYIYLQSKDFSDSVYVKYSKIPEYLIQYNDVLRVTIKSIDPKASELFNLYSGMNMNMGAQAASAGDPFYMIGYPVDGQGMVNIPGLGKVHVRGLSVEGATTRIQEEVDKFFNGAFVNVQIGGIRYSLLGEVNRPGKYTVLQDRLTILEALAQGGDLNTVANRHEVQIIRQTPEGAHIVKIDLTDRNLIASPYYFVRPNDVIYVQPLKAREYGTGLTAQQTLQTIVLSISLLVNTVLLYDRLTP